jgi:type VI secretion system protein ImpE
MTPQELYQSGQLTEAIQAAIDVVKKAPTDTDIRGFLCELFCFAGDLERADKQLDAIGLQKPEAMVGVSLVRQLVRAETCRQEFHTAGRLPEFLHEPPEYVRLHLEATICVRDGKPDEAIALLEKAEEQRPKLKGTCNGDAFEDIRDLDDLSASYLEVLTSNGKYYWIPFESIIQIDFLEPKRPQDLLWRQVHMIINNGPEGDVYLPTLYFGTQNAEDDQLRLGRGTEWIEEPGHPVRGVGQREFLVGEGCRSILELEKITFTGHGDL